MKRKQFLATVIGLAVLPKLINSVNPKRLELHIKNANPILLIKDEMCEVTTKTSDGFKQIVIKPYRMTSDNIKVSDEFLNSFNQIRRS